MRCSYQSLTGKWVFRSYHKSSHICKVFFNVLSHGNEEFTHTEVECMLSSERGEFPKYEILVHDEEF